MDSVKDQVQVLGKQTNKPLDRPEVLEVEFKTAVVVELDCSEFTSYCPVTGQPDFGRLTIRYRPDGRILETKSLKLYLLKFRDTRGFNEQLVDQICRELYNVLRPHYCLVDAEFHARGGIAVKPHAEVYRSITREGGLNV